MTLTITISDRLGQAVKNKGAEFELDAPGYVKAMLFAAAAAAGGATANDVVPLKTV